jgi:hypothetical protein
MASVLNEEDLYYHCDAEDAKEEGVVEEISEYVELGLVDLAAVDLIKDLHEDERVEDHRIVKPVVCCPGLIRPPELDPKEPTTTEQKYREHDHLECALP